MGANIGAEGREAKLFRESPCHYGWARPAFV